MNAQHFRNTEIINMYVLKSLFREKIGKSLTKPWPNTNSSASHVWIAVRQLAKAVGREREGERENVVFTAAAAQET